MYGSEQALVYQLGVITHLIVLSHWLGKPTRELEQRDREVSQQLYKINPQLAKEVDHELAKDVSILTDLICGKFEAKCPAKSSTVNEMTINRWAILHCFQAKYQGYQEEDGTTVLFPL